MFKALVYCYGKDREVMVVSITPVPQIEMVRNDLEYSIKQTIEYHVVFIDEHGELDSIDTNSLSNITLVKEG